MGAATPPRRHVRYGRSPPSRRQVALLQISSTSRFASSRSESISLGGQILALAVVARLVQAPALDELLVAILRVGALLVARACATSLSTAFLASFAVGEEGAEAGLVRGTPCSYGPHGCRAIRPPRHAHRRAACRRTEFSPERRSTCRPPPRPSPTSPSAARTTKRVSLRDPHLRTTGRAYPPLPCEYAPPGRDPKRKSCHRRFYPCARSR